MIPISTSFITLFPSIRVHLLRFIVHHLRLLIYCLDQVRRGSQKMAEDGAMSETEDFPEFDLGALGTK